MEGPRYTSFPTVPHWDPSRHNQETWKSSIIEGFWQSGKELSLYIHLPFCESLCTYCGCTTRITKNHAFEEEYIQYLLKEWRLYLNAFSKTPILKELHLGGGTPTFFSEKNLRFLIEEIFSGVKMDSAFEGSFEGHPANTTKSHLKVLASLGFKRISLGIQDFNPDVQKLINRHQTVQQVQEITDTAKQYGFHSINFDLIYGLPGQSEETIKETINHIIGLGPTRIAFYGYAHVPWIKPGQKSFEIHLPTPNQRLSMYSLGKSMLTDNGYQDIGMDHFALPADSLFEAYLSGHLHRNFMGYTTQSTDLLIGLGMSSISDSWSAFSQNEKHLPDYYKKLDDGLFPIHRGHLLTSEDLLIRKHILNLMCRFSTKWTTLEDLDKFNTDLLEELKEDGLINLSHEGIEVTDSGKPFIRNICMALDAYLWNSNTKVKFSQTV